MSFGYLPREDVDVLFLFRLTETGCPDRWTFTVYVCLYLQEISEERPVNLKLK